MWYQSMRVSLIMAVSLLALPAIAQQIEVTVNGEPVRFSGIGPQQVQGRVMVPLRGVLEKLGAYVDWVPSTRTVVATRGDLDIQLPLGGRIARVNGREVLMDVPAMTMSGSTMVPLRFVGETLGAEVRWDAATQTVMIQTNQAVAANRPHITEPPAPRRNLEVSSLTHNVRDGWLRAGEPVRVTMRGTPGGQAVFRIPGLAQDVRMRETSEGVYEGEWVVPGDKPLNLSSATVIGEIRSGDATSPLIQTADPLRVDTAAPKVEDFYPAINARIVRRRAPITISLTDQGGSGIDRNRTKILLDRQDVTADAAITDRFITFTPTQPLAFGRHAVDVVVFDKAGNSTTHNWSFDVAERQNAIRSVTHNADRILEPGDVLNVRVEGVPGSRARFTLGTIKEIALAESSPGIYTGSYTIKKGDDIGRAPLSVAFTTPQGEQFTETSEQAVRVTTGPPAQPSITFPAANDSLTNPLVIRGRGTPNSTIQLRVDYQNKVLGIFAVRGTAAEQEILVGANGVWESRPIDASSLLGKKGTEYTITAMAIGPNEEKSAVTTLRLTTR